MVHCETKRNLKTFKLKFGVEEGSKLVEKRREDPRPVQWIYITVETDQHWQCDNIIFGINTNSSSADRREGTDLETLSGFTEKNNFWFWKYLANFLAVQGSLKHLDDSWENEQRERKKMGDK